MPERFDLLKVDYIDSKDGKKAICFAPHCEVGIGDTIETAFGRAIVIDRIGFCDKNDKVYQFISDVTYIDRVLFKIRPIKYEEEEDAVSEN